MLIVSFKPGHDGAVAILKDGSLRASLEAEKDTFPRYDYLGAPQFIDALSYVEKMPDVVCLGGWRRGNALSGRKIGAGYFGTDKRSVTVENKKFIGKEIKLFSSTHERSHIFGSVGLSPYADKKDCYCLVWEGDIGRFYKVTKAGEIHPYPTVVPKPGNKYAFLYSLADPTAPDNGEPRHEDAGKLMALTSYAASGTPTAREAEVINWTLSRSDNLRTNGMKGQLSDSYYYNIGVTHPDFCRLARHFSDALFDRFETFARKNLNERLPLVISGGCGLNCDWNDKWRRTNIFEDVFVPPCPNDSGSALGTAIDAQHHFTGLMGVQWSVYAGQQFQNDRSHASLGIIAKGLDFTEVARDLQKGEIVPLIQGACEIGPRALGNRSILAEPFKAATRELLNHIKQREQFRPIAPVVIESEMHKHFDGHSPSPYMLEFARVKDPSLQAITHVDGSARPQTVRPDQNPVLYKILEEFQAASGAAVLCNTSLNFKGYGFINRLSDLTDYCREKKIIHAVVNQHYLKFG